MKNCIIVTYSFPPLNDIAARRFGEIAPFMEKFGWKPWIITTESSGSLPLSIPSSQCFRIGRHPQQGAQVEQVNPDINKLPPLLDRLRKTKLYCNNRLLSIDRTVPNWYKLIVKNVQKIMTAIPKADLLVASYGPAASIWGGHYLASAYNIPWIADFRDPGAIKRINRSYLAYAADMLVEKNRLSSASGLMTTGYVWARALEKNHKKPCLVAYNGWAELPKKKTRQKDDDKTSYIYYAGRIYRHQLKAFFLLLQAMKSFEKPELKLKIRSLGPCDMERSILDYAEEIGISEKIEILPPVNQETVIQEALGASANLVVEDMDTTDELSAGTLTGKFLQLLVYDPPILAIARQDSEIGEILQETLKGRLCSNPKHVTSFLEEHVLRKNPLQPDPRAIQKFSKMEQAKKMCSFFDSILT